MNAAGVVLVWWVLFAGTHLLLSAAALRQRLLARLGERGFQGVYSVVALATFIPLVRAYWLHRHAGPLLWSLRDVPAARGVAMLLAAAGVMLVVLSFFQPSATGMVPGAPTRPRGVIRITRHPFFGGVGLWALGHTLMNGFLSGVIFFGGFVVFWLVGAAHQDARKRQAAGEDLRAFYAETSTLPFAAVMSGRTALMAGEIPWLGVIIGGLLAVVLYTLHGWWFGV